MPKKRKREIHDSDTVATDALSISGKNVISLAEWRRQVEEEGAAEVRAQILELAPHISDGEFRIFDRKALDALEPLML